MIRYARQEWQQMPQRYVQTLIRSMHHRADAVVDNDGGNTHYSTIVIHVSLLRFVNLLISLMMSSWIAQLWLNCYVSNSSCPQCLLIICMFPKCYFWNSTFTRLSVDRISSNQRICTKIGMLVENMFLHIGVNFEQYSSRQKKVMRSQKNVSKLLCLLLYYPHL